MKRTNADQELRRVGVFSPDPELQRTLSNFEQNIHRALNAHKEQKAEKHQITAVVKSDTLAQIGQTLLYDTTGGSFVITLPRVTQNEHGKTITLKAVSSVLTSIIIKPATGQKVDGLDVTSVVGDKISTRLVSDGSGWWIV